MAESTRNPSASALIVTGWTSLANVYATDSNHAIASVTTAIMAATGFGFAIPETAIINGILITCIYQGAGNNVARRELTLQMTKDGSTGAGDATAVTLSLANTDQTRTVGGADSLLGTTWTPAEINASTLGVLLRPSNVTGYERRVDHVYLTIYYTEPAEDTLDTPQATAVINAVDSLSLSQESDLTVADCANVIVDDAPATLIIELGTVYFKDEDVTFKDEDVVFEPHESVSLVIADGIQPNVTEDVALEIEYVLAVEDAYNSNVGEDVNIGGSLILQDGTQRNVAESPALIQEALLSLSDGIQNNVTNLFSLGYVEGEPEGYAIWVDTTDAEFHDTDDAEFYPHEQETFALDDTAQVNVTEDVTLLVEHWLSVNSAYNANTVDGVLLQIHVTADSLVTADCVQVNESDFIEALEQEYVLTVSDTAQVNAAESPSLADIEYGVTADDGIQLNVTEDVFVYIEGIDYLTVQNATQQNVTETVQLEIEFGLIVQNSSVANVTETVSIYGDNQLVVANAFNANDAESVQLSQEHPLTVYDTSQSVTQDELALEQEHTLNTSDSDVEQYADDVTISDLSADTLTVSDGKNQNVVDALVLIQEYVASNLDCAQLQSADTLQLVIEQALILANGTQFNYVQNVNLVYSESVLGDIIDPYLISLTAHRYLVSTTPQRYIMQ